MTTNTNAALAEAERLLRRDAESLRECYTSHQDRDNWAGEDDAKAGYDEYIRAADALAALTTAAAVPPEGWVMVPVKPTEEMKAAAVKYANGPAVYKNLLAEVLRIEEGIYGEVYEAMLAARPGGHP